jgi:hypothetical protein
MLLPGLGLFSELNTARCVTFPEYVCVFQNPVSENFAVLWTIFSPFLFGLIGNEIDLYFLDLRIVGLGIACLGVSLAVSN